MSFFLGGRSKGDASRFSLRDKFHKQPKQSTDDSDDSGVEELSNVFAKRATIEKKRPSGREPKRFLGEEFPTDAPRTRSSVQRAMEEEAEELEAQELEDQMPWAAHRKPITRTESGASGADGSRGPSNGAFFHVRQNPAFEKKEGDSSDSDTGEVIVRRPDNVKTATDFNRGPLRGPALNNLAQRALFLNTPSPQDQLIQCFVTREKDRTGLYPQFQLYLTNGEQFLLAARRRK
eukprot:5261126-Pyramimonas_sp.AAC.1